MTGGFWSNFFSSLGHTLGSNLATITITVCCILLGALVLYQFPFFFALFRAASDFIVAQLAKLPFLANGVYLSKIHKNKRTIKLCRDQQAEAEGERQKCEDDILIKKEEYEKQLARARHFKASGNEEAAILCVREALLLEKECNSLKEAIPNLEAVAIAAQKKIETLSVQNEHLRRERKENNNTRRRANLLLNSNESLLGDNTSAEDEILEHYQEHVNERRNLARGSEIVLNQTLENRMKAVDDQILDDTAKKLLKTL